MGRILLFFLVSSFCNVFAQTPTSSKDGAAYISADDIQSAIQKPGDSGVQDAVLRVLPVNRGYNVGVSVVRRTRINGQTVRDALQHHAITEIYEVRQGCGSLVAGGALVGANELPANDPDLLQQIGPTALGTEIKSGQARHIGVGDIVVIPPDTPHGFSEICAEGITYTVVRIDGKRLLRLK
jgi:hypothetical protein